jgi:hypothetical protein
MVFAQACAILKKNGYNFSEEVTTNKAKKYKKDILKISYLSKVNIYTYISSKISKFDYY